MPGSSEVLLLSRKFDRPVHVETAGRRVLLVVVHESNAVRQASLAGLGLVVSTDGEQIRWNALGGSDKPVRCYGEDGFSWAMQFLRQQGMGKEEQMAGYVRRGWRQFRRDFGFLSNGAAVVDKVRRDVNGIGFLQYNGQSLEGVRVLAISATEGSAAVTPKLEPMMQVDYPLSEPLVLYLHPKAPPVAKQFCDFAISHEGSAVLEKLGFVTPTTEFRHLAGLRLSEMKSGKGDKLAACGAVGSGVGAGRAVREMMGGLAEEFVRAKEVVQVAYSPVANDVAGMGAFLATAGTGDAARPRQELLLLDDRPGERAIQAHGQRWSDLAPAEYLIAGRGVAVIVNPASSVGSLTLDQIRSIFSADVMDWSIIGGSGAGSGAGGRASGGGTGGGAGGAKQEIKVFALPQADVATEIFGKECLLPNQWRRVTIKKTSAEVMQAVAADPAAIGIVDLATVGPIGLAGLPSDRTVKVLSIGAGAQAIPPTPDNLKNAMYPLSQRLYLYVHPQASDTAKDFANFMATCGGSEATPYADTVKAVMETYQKNGLIPLAEVAIARMAKDALAAAAGK